MEEHALILLHRVQTQLQTIYDIDVNYDIRNFTITDRIIAEAIGQANHRSAEQLLINQQEDCLDISLFLDQSVLDILHKKDPYAALHDENLTSYWLAVEGVSHFLYVAWRANFDRQVSQLELELQAEVDKFVCAAELLNLQRSSIDTQDLWERLFKNFYLHHHLDAEQAKRYIQANEYASEYCKNIHTSLKQSHSGTDCYQQLRRFYRMGQRAKMAYISATH